MKRTTGTAPATLDKRWLDRIRNHRIAAVGVAAGTVLIGIASFTDAVTKLATLVTGGATPDIQSVLVDQSETAYRLAVSVRNPTTAPFLITGIRIFERLHIPEQEGTIRVCAADYTLYVSPQLKLQARAQRQILVVSRVSEDTDLGFGREAHGLLAVECGGDVQEFALWADMAAPAASATYTTIYVHVPKTFSVDVPEYQRRRSAAHVSELDRRFPVIENAPNRLIPDPAQDYKPEPHFTLDSKHFTRLESVPAATVHILQVDLHTDLGKRLSFAWDFQRGTRAPVRDTPPGYGS